MDYILVSSSFLLDQSIIFMLIKIISIHIPIAEKDISGSIPVQISKLKRLESQFRI